MDMHFWLIFLASLLGVSLIPGPSTIIAFSHGARYGSSKALYTASGNSAASLLQALAASAGLGIIITTSALLFMIIKYLGAAYLVYIGIQMWRNADANIHFNETEYTGTTKRRHLMSRGFLVAAGNPKAIVFFTALFPQFLSVNGNGDSTYQLTGMVIVVGFVAFTVAALYGCLGGWIGRLTLSTKLMRRINKTTGGVFIASGIGLATAKQ